LQLVELFRIATDKETFAASVLSVENWVKRRFGEDFPGNLS